MFINQEEVNYFYFEKKIVVPFRVIFSFLQLH